MEIYQYTNKGQRKENQDYTVYKVLPSGDSIFIVADGMGGYSRLLLLLKQILISMNLKPCWKTLSKGLMKH